MRSTVTSKGQITLPKWVRDLLGIAPGSVVDFERAADGRVILVKSNTRAEPSHLARLRGHAGKGPSTDEIMAMLRSDR